MKTQPDYEDLRVRRTHKLLWEALMALLSEQAFENITVRTICERAMVHRTTFYKHYSDKYALLEQGMHHMYDALIAEVNAPPHIFSIDRPPPYFIHLFTHVAKYQHIYRLVLSKQSTSTFQQLFHAYLVENTELKIRAFTSHSQQPPVPSAIYAHFLAGAIISTLIWWLEHDMLYPPQQMAQYLLELQRTPRPK